MSDLVPFWQYLDIVTRSTSIALVRAAGAGTGALGSFGYVVALLQVAGFALGGFLVYAYLTDLPYCVTCSRYLARKGSQKRYTSDAEGLRVATLRVLEHIAAGEMAAAIQEHTTVGNPICQKGDHLRSTIDIGRCKTCDQHWLKFRVDKRSGNDRKEIPELTTSGFTDQVVGV